MIQISKSVWIECAHHFPAHPIEENRRVHGHSMKITVSATGDRRAGAIMDFSVFGAQVKAIADLLDHRMLNDLPDLEFPTLENIAEWFGRRFAITGPLTTVRVLVERPHRGEAAEWTP